MSIDTKEVGAGGRRNYAEKEKGENRHPITIDSLDVRHARIVIVQMSSGQLTVIKAC
jgi:hypothetical protein